jgi:hypothetical protein
MFGKRTEKTVNFHTLLRNRKLNVASKFKLNNSEWDILLLEYLKQLKAGPAATFGHVPESHGAT